MNKELAGRVAIISVDSAEAEPLARRLVRAGATVVLAGAGAGAEAAGRLVAALEAEAGGRAAFFLLDDCHDGAQLDALVEFVAELGGPRRPISGQ